MTLSILRITGSNESLTPEMDSYVSFVIPFKVISMEYAYDNRMTYTTAWLAKRGEVDMPGSAYDVEYTYGSDGNRRKRVWLAKGKRTLRKSSVTRHLFAVSGRGMARVFKGHSPFCDLRGMLSLG